MFFSFFLIYSMYINKIQVIHELEDLFSNHFKSADLIKSVNVACKKYIFTMFIWKHGVITSVNFYFRSPILGIFFRHLNLKCLKLAVPANFVPHTTISLVHVVRSDVKKWPFPLKKKIKLSTLFTIKVKIKCYCGFHRKLSSNTLSAVHLLNISFVKGWILPYWNFLLLITVSPKLAQAATVCNNTLPLLMTAWTVM